MTKRENCLCIYDGFDCCSPSLCKLQMLAFIPYLFHSSNEQKTSRRIIVLYEGVGQIVNCGIARTYVNGIIIKNITEL